LHYQRLPSPVLKKERGLKKDRPHHPNTRNRGKHPEDLEGKGSNNSTNSAIETAFYKKVYLREGPSRKHREEGETACLLNYQPRLRPGEKKLARPGGGGSCDSRESSGKRISLGCRDPME